MRYLGIDLAWSAANGSGVAALAAGPGGVLEVVAAGTVRTDAELLTFVLRHRGRASVTMVDAPLTVPNETGMRECDRETHRRYGAREAGAYPANRRTLGRYNGGVLRGESLAAQLAHHRARQAPLARAGRGHTVYECYPHPAQVELFGLARTLKYKKKQQPWPVARRAFRRYLDLLLALRAPALHLDPAHRAALDPRGVSGAAYKAREDELDAIFCAYLAALAPLGRLEMLGSIADGHIVVPRSAS